MLEPLTRWRCDFCSRPVAADTAYIVWRYDADQDIEYDFKIIHQGRCDPGDRDDNGYPHSMELVHFLGEEGLSKLLSFLSEGKAHLPNRSSVKNLDEFVDFTRRLHTPFYEEARTRFGDPAVQVLAQNLSPDQFYTPETLQQIVYGVQT